MNTLIAIDPGKTGGLAIRNHDGTFEAMKMPSTVRDLIDALEEVVKGHYHDEFEPPIVIIEDVPPFAGKAQSGSSAFKLGKNVGQIEGVIQCLNLRMEKVRPQTWMKALGLGTRNGSTPTQWKNKLKNRAQELHPDLKLTLATCDAVLLLEYFLKGAA